jgi:leucine dehydrogenase
MAEIIETGKKASAQSSVLTQMSLHNHEQVVFCNDNETGLKAIIAIHNTVLGPALGGTRMWMYNNEAEALNDVLRLSRGMTYKASISGLNLGGGKAVIIGDSSKHKNEFLMRRFGKFVNSLAGKYITAEDVGIGTRDMEFVKMETNHVTGLPESMGGGGDPSPVTAFGVYMGMKASAKMVYGNDSLNGKKVFVQGIGHVGEHLVKHLLKEGAKVTIHDINQARLKEVASETGAQVFTGTDIFDADMDIYSPCALGASVNDHSLAKMKCSIIAGAANNQLEDEQIHGQGVLDKGIVWAPDFLINAGGLINVYSELQGYNRQTALSQAEKIYQVTLDVLNQSKEKSVPTIETAKLIAEKRIASIGKIKLSR